MLRADNHGEGGIFALLSLVPRSKRRLSPWSRYMVVFAAISGAALLYGDGIITPAISVLSAVEGLHGDPRCAQDHASTEAGGHQDRTCHDHLLPGKGDPPQYREIENEPLAQSPLCADFKKYSDAHGLFPPAPEPGCGAGHRN